MSLKGCLVKMKELRSKGLLGLGTEILKRRECVGKSERIQQGSRMNTFWGVGVARIFMLKISSDALLSKGNRYPFIKYFTR